MEHEAGGWRDVAPTAEVPSEGVRRFDVGGRKMAVGRGGGGLFAVDGTCPHAGGDLGEGFVDDSQLICPLHAFAFDVRTGRCPDDESLCLDVFEVRERDGRIEVRLEPSDGS